MTKPRTAAKKVNPMLAVTWAAPDLELELAPLASETGGPVAVASTPAITGPPLVAWIRQGFN